MEKTNLSFFDKSLALFGLSRSSAPVPQRNVIPKQDLFTKTIKEENPRNLWGLYMNEFSELNPSYIHYINEASRKGLNFYKSLLFEDIRRKDLHIGAICQTRKSGISKKNYEIRYDAKSKVSKREQDSMTEFIEENFKRFDIDNFISDCIEAQIQGVSTFEVNYEPDGSQIMIKSVDYIPNHMLLFDDIKNEYRYFTLDKLDQFLIRGQIASGFSMDRIQVQDLSLPVISPYKIIEIHSLDGNAQNGFLNGCHTSLIWAYFFKNYTIKDYGSFIEQHGIPPILASYDPLMNDAEKAALWNAISEWGHIFKLMYPNTAKVDFMNEQNKQANGNLFLDNINWWNDAIAIRVIGQTLTTDVGKVGSYAAALVHNLVREDIIANDMKVVKKGVNNLIRNLIELNFGKNKNEYPEFHWEVESDIIYQEARSNVFMNVKNSGYRVKKEVIESELDLQVEDIPVNNNNNNNSPHFKEQNAGRRKYLFGDKYQNKISDKEAGSYIKDFFNKHKSKL